MMILQTMRHCCKLNYPKIKQLKLAQSQTSTAVKCNIHISSAVIFIHKHRNSKTLTTGNIVLHNEYFYFSYFKYILLKLTCFYLRKVLSAGLLLVEEYFHSAVLVLLLLLYFFHRWSKEKIAGLVYLSDSYRFFCCLSR